MEAVYDFLKVVMDNSINLFTIINPLGVGSIMISMMNHDADKAEFRDVAYRNSKTVFIAMTIIFLIGSYLFQFFGINTFSLQVFGGLILFMIGFNMVNGRDKKLNASEKEREAAVEKEDIAIVPLAIPIIVGPGVTSVIINLNEIYEEKINMVAVIVSFLIVSIANFLILSNMKAIKKRLGMHGLKVLSRIMGLVVGSLAAQLLIKGLKGLWEIS